MNPLARFFKLPTFVVVGASNNREKFGNKILRCYVEYNRNVVPISKLQPIIENLESFQSLTTFIEHLRSKHSNVRASDIGVSIVTPPVVTKQVLEEGLQLGYRHFMLQPGTVDNLVEEFIKAKCKEDSTIDIIHSCVLREIAHFSETEEEFL